MTATMVTPPTHIILLQDAVSDTPVFRSNVEHFEDQVELLERWLDNLVRSLKHYSEELSRLNLQTTELSKRAIPTVDESVMDMDFTHAVVRAFADALQASLAFKQKMVNDMEERLLAPIQHFIKTELKEFKEVRKNYRKTEDKYESMLNRYNSLSKSKEASSLREDAFQLYEIRKSYIKASADYALRITAFKAALDYILVDQFVNGIQAEADFHEGSYEVYKSLRKPIIQWKAWLGESKSTNDYQISLLRSTRKSLEEEAIALARPHRSLTTYNAPSSVSLFANPDAGGVNSASSITKYGYLYHRTTTGKPARVVWTRRWFFVEDGWFGSHTVSTVGKTKGCIVSSERIGVLLCDVKQNAEQDRRFCFEVVSVKPQTSFLLQAETEDDLQEWISTFERARRFIVENAQQPLDASNPTNIDTSTTTSTTTLTATAPKVAEEIHDERTEPQATDDGSDGERRADKRQSGSSGSDSERRPNSSRSSLPPSTNLVDSGSPTLPNRPANSASSLASMMMREAARQGTDLMQKAGGNPSAVAGAWNSIPWTLVPGASLFINPQSGDGEQSGDGMAPAEGYSVSSGDPGSGSASPTWVGRDRSGSLSGATRPRSGSLGGSGGAGGMERGLSNGSLLAGDNNVLLGGSTDDDVRVTEIIGYPTELDLRNKQLRKLFSSVDNDEVVLDVFLGAILQRPRDTTKDSVTSSINPPPTPPRSSHGYAYSGRTFLTQRSLYFHSRVVMSCVNTLIIRLKDVTSIKLARDATSAPGGDVVLVIETQSASESQEKEKVMLRVLMEDAELVMEKINIAAAAARADSPMKLQHLFEVVRSMRKGVSVFVTPTTTESPIANAPNSSRSAPTQNTKTVDESRTVTEPSTSSKQAETEKRKDTGSEGTVAAETRTSSEEKPAGQAPPVDEDTFPPNIPVPTGPVSCGCDDHLEKKEIEIELNVSARRLYELMFSNAGAPILWEKMNRQKGNTAIQVGTWAMVDGETRRILKYTMPINNPMVKAKDTEVTETHQLCQERPYLAYTVQASTKTPQLPYADAFLPVIRYCITYVSEKRCKLTCYTGIKWFKSPMVKSVITKVTMKGLTETVTVLANVVQSDVQLVNRSGAPTPKRPAHRVERQGSIIIGGTRHRHSSSSSSIRRKHKSREDGGSGTISGAEGTAAEREGASTERRGSTRREPLDGTTKQAGSGMLAPISDAMELVLDIVTLEKRLFIGAILVITFVWYMWPLIGTGYKSETVSYQVDPHVQIRAVYIRDLEEGLFRNAGWIPANKKYESYSLFLQSRPTFSMPYQSSTAVASPKPTSINTSEDSFTTSVTPYNWFTTYHRLFASELLLTRERVGILRHDLLLTFQVLNNVEKRLLESEYVNWLLDGRARCVREESRQGDSKLCEEVEQQLVDFLMPAAGRSRT